MRSAFAILAIVSGCTHLPAHPGGSVTVVISSRDRTTGEFVAEIHNRSNRPILVLDPLAEYSTVPKGRLVRRPEFSDELAIVFHDRKVQPGAKHVFSSVCSPKGLCSTPGQYIGFYVCQFSQRWQCHEYQLLWSSSPVNAS